MADEKTQKWMLTHDSHSLKKGEIYEGASLPAWLAGKATPVSDRVFEVATPGELKKLQAELDASKETNGKLQAELDEAQKQLSDLQKKGK